MGHSRNGRPKRTRRYDRISDIEKANKRAFHEAAWAQRVCAVCGASGEYESHHVIERQKLRIIGRLDLVWDLRNALRLCGDCHAKHTGGWRRVFLSRLTDENYEFAWFVLGMEAADYLRRIYQGKDHRWTALNERCEAAHREQREAAVG